MGIQRLSTGHGKVLFNPPFKEGDAMRYFNARVVGVAITKYVVHSVDREGFVITLLDENDKRIPNAKVSYLASTVIERRKT